MERDSSAFFFVSRKNIFVASGIIFVGGSIIFVPREVIVEENAFVFVAGKKNYEDNLAEYEDISSDGDE